MATRSPRPTHPPVRDAVVVGGNRIPFARAGKAYGDASNHELLTAAVEGLVARFGLQGERLGEVVAGAVLKHSRDFNLVRECVLGSSLSPQTPAYDVQQACATGLEAAIAVTNKIKLGQIDSGIAGGTDTISDAPVAVSDGLRRALLDASHAKTLQGRLKALAKLRPADLKPLTPATDEPRTGLSMGEHQAVTTARWGVSREDQDQVALASHQNLARAWDEGFFDDLVTPFRGLTRDDNLRPDTSLEKLGTLRPVFGKALGTAEPTMTAGNSTPLTDGASAVLLASREWAAAHDLPVLARFVDAETAAVDFVHGHEGLLMAPAHAVPRLLARNGLKLGDIDFFEIHEAFASTVLTTLAAWEDDEYCRTELGLPGALGPVDRAKINVNGSSLAAGHPFAATGGRILAAAAKLVSQRAAATGKPARALISVCAAGGLGATALIESV
ncbi:acetyl-CoA acetyltransferase [Xylanimonas cellulosilytica DSM 15894]|uniref:Acetyl-CoA acetyltransferase n=1 Tax=Xylanimonas cellulosilytica (strain DSM 15894 / JCM 12276 / CECT 5975 / KCTC 9989 / LMG 20990 / NBRC 107835 / XIL07) TaxID=446471 RepID=D1BZY6_XYLCX|nr:acetyl-CoA C-acetyltransferase [Xylanimonas cellulosilytica]ACZ32114.1 acetyl-CoA acetyltransferase [Xylanimonas cellulosilytica DSM 15894]